MQEINRVLDTNLINNALTEITSMYRYNVSNSIEYPFTEFYSGETNQTYYDSIPVSEWLLSTYTKRFMVLISHDARGEEVTPLFTVKVNCAISGDYQHTVTQTNGTWNNWTYVVFDFTQNEVKNSINVTDANGVPTKGVFTLQLINSESKIVTEFSDRYRMYFIMVGSGIESPSILLPRNTIPDTHVTFLNNLQTGKMKGYTRTSTSHNSFALENGLNYPDNQFTARNFVIPTRPFRLSETGTSYRIVFNPNSDSDIIKLLTRLDQKILMLSGEPPELTTQFYVDNGVTPNRVFTFMNSIRNTSYELWMYNFKESFVTSFSGTVGLFDFNNVLVVEPSVNIIKEFLPYQHPLVLPQTSTSLTGSTNYKIYDNLLSNYFVNFYQMYFNTMISKLNLTQNQVQMFNQDGDFSGLTNTVIPNQYGHQPMFFDYNPDAHIVIEGFNSDTNHNIYCNISILP